MVRAGHQPGNLLGYVAKRVCRHSHDSMMKENEIGLRDYCDAHRTLDHIVR